MGEKTKSKIFLVDDDSLSVKVMTALLAESGH